MQLPNVSILLTLFERIAQKQAGFAIESTLSALSDFYVKIWLLCFLLGNKSVSPKKKKGFQFDAPKCGIPIVNPAVL